MSLTILEEYIETGNHQDLDLLLSRMPELVQQKTSHNISPLLLACYYHKAPIVQVILKHLKSITIHEACAAGLTNQVEHIISINKEIIHEVSPDGFTPLGIASHFGKEDIVRILLSHHADPNTCSQNGYNVYPLHSALNINHTDISKMLIEAGAEVNVVQSQRLTPLHLAAQHGNIDIIILLLEHGADITVRNELGQNASDIAAERGFNEIADILNPH